MVDYEIVCVGIAFLYGKQDKKDKVVRVRVRGHAY